ncbi:hypothetical protein A7U60_g2233 [Sanghuangporus baumii]|uniref:Uncharacterized protein n=1 Tax=Sanghuangporus baumii TaxID=108892 RepID=A0A9Q5N8C1_SANBA|nr:hypothetical protein A7U60_g2233 [Sanghuangporus baumii]
MSHVDFERIRNPYSSQEGAESKALSCPNPRWDYLLPRLLIDQPGPDSTLRRTIYYLCVTSSDATGTFVHYYWQRLLIDQPGPDSTLRSKHPSSILRANNEFDSGAC